MVRRMLEGSTAFSPTLGCGFSRRLSSCLKEGQGCLGRGEKEGVTGFHQLKLMGTQRASAPSL